MPSFFSNTFEFGESDYKQTQKDLLRVSTFTDAPSDNAPYFREQCNFELSSGKTVSAGVFSIPSVMELREHATRLARKKHPENRELNINVQNMKGDARSLHTGNEVKRGAPVIMQAASQFNLLEFPSPGVTPEAGISEYVFDKTQGPACAIACAAGTAYRNYLVPVPFPDVNGKNENFQRGQTRDNQLNGLVDLEAHILRETHLNEIPWTVKNGYVESNREKLTSLNQVLSKLNNNLQNDLTSRLRIGLQEDTTVTDDPLFETKVTQTYNSALSIGYSKLPETLWEPLAQLVLDATYEATLLVGVIQGLLHPDKPPPVIFLTKIGGGVFQNRSIWIRQAMTRAIKKVLRYEISLEIRIVHFGNIDERYNELDSLSICSTK